MAKNRRNFTGSEKLAVLREHMIACLLEWIASDILPSRLSRVEPRRRKRRPKEYSLLNKPREWYRQHDDDGAR